MQPFVSFVLGLAALALNAAAPPVKVWVELRDKGPVGATRGLPLLDRAFEDAPIYAPYLERLRAAGFRPEISLKWQNRVSGWIAPADTATLARLPMVRGVQGMPRKAPRGPLPKAGASADFGAFQSLFSATGAAALRSVLPANRGLGLRVAVIDESFYLGHEAFAHLWRQNRIVDQWDFVANQPVAAFNSLGASHGAGVLSLLGGKSADFEGLVPEASFLLYRSENDFSETYVEEDYVAAALERAVDSGAQVINISLGYRYDYSDGSPNLPYSDFNGRTRPSSIAALMAARRGALVSIAMGNDGQAPATLGAPADADSVLSVGIVDANLNPCSYSSTGPTADGRIKPELSSYAPISYCRVPHANSATDSGLMSESGTSFAAPVVAGIAALLRQLHPDAPAQDIRLALMFSARHASQPDNRSGYGLANAVAAHRLLSLRMENGLALFRPKGRHTVSWLPRLNPAGASLWDLRGRALPVTGGPAGLTVWIESESEATGVYVWRVPVQ